MDLATLWSLVSVLLHVTLQLVVAFRVLMRRQPLANTHAWLLLVLFVPIAGIVLYVLIGENRLGARRAQSYHRSEREIEPLERRLAERWGHDWADDRSRFRGVAQLGERICGMPVLSGDRVSLLSDASGTLEAMIADIDAAHSHVHLLTYIFQPDGKALEVVGALERAAARGVECRVAVDGAGSKRFLRSGLPGRLRRSGVEVAALLPVNPVRLLLARLDLRNHRKVLVVDGTVAYCGSQNITDERFRPPGVRHVGSWTDATARVQGPTARALSLLFAADWNAEVTRPITDLERYLPEHDGPDSRQGASAVQVLPSGPGARPRAIQSAIVTTMYAAREELTVTTPYFVPDQTVLSGLMSAAERGVRVTLVVPERSDQRIVAAAGRSSYEDLLIAGVRVMHYRPGLLHAKTITVDGQVSLIGSANLDQRSFWLNFEVTLAVYDPAFTAQLRTLQEQYITQSDEVTSRAWSQRTWLKRAWDNTAQLLAPLL